MVDQTIQFLDGIAKDILVKIQDDYVPADFIILDMGIDEEIPLILGRSFLNTTNVVIYVGSGQIHFQFLGWKVKCAFNSYKTNKQVEEPSQIGGIAQNHDKRIDPRRTSKKNKSRRMNLSNQNQTQNKNGFGGRKWHHHKCLHLRNQSRHSTNKLCKKKYGSKDRKHRTLAKR